MYKYKKQDKKTFYLLTNHTMVFGLHPEEMEEKIPFGCPIENEQQRKNITEGFKAESKKKKEEETEKNKKEIKNILSKGKTTGKDRKRIKDLLEDL